MTEKKLVIKDTPTPQLRELRAEMMKRPAAFKIHIKAIEITIRERGEAVEAEAKPEPVICN